MDTEREGYSERTTRNTDTATKLMTSFGSDSQSVRGLNLLASNVST